MFKKTLAYGKAFAVGTKNALDPKRLKAEGEKALALAFVMPNASTSTLPEMTGLLAEAPVPAAEAQASRQRAVAALSGSALAPIWLDRLYTPRPLASDLAMALHQIGLDAAQVYGVYPSSQLLRPGELDRHAGWWEWCILHAGGDEVSQRIQQTSNAITAGQSPAHGTTPMVVTQMSRTRRWIDRPKSAPMLFDEEAAGAVIARAGINPEHSFGVSRILVWAPMGQRRHPARSFPKHPRGPGTPALASASPSNRSACRSSAPPAPAPTSCPRTWRRWLCRRDRISAVTSV